MVVAIALSVVLHASPTMPPLVDVPLAATSPNTNLESTPLSLSDVEGLTVDTRLSRYESAQSQKTWSEVLFWTGAGVLATGMYLLVQSVQGPRELRPAFSRDAVVTSSTAVGLLGAGVALGIHADAALATF